MKRYRIITPVLVFLVIVGAALAVRLWPRTVPDVKCGEIYRRYAAVEGMETAFIKGYRLSGAVGVDVTLLKACSDSAWVLLQEDFDITPLPQEALDFLGTDTNAVTFWKVHRDDLSPVEDPLCTDFYLIVLQECRRTLTVFSIESAEQSRAVFMSELTEMEKAKNL